MAERPSRQFIQLDTSSLKLDHKDPMYRLLEDLNRALRQIWGGLDAAEASIKALMGSDPYTVSNATALRDYDVSTVTLTDLANVVAAIIEDLKSKGILS